MRRTTRSLGPLDALPGGARPGLSFRSRAGRPARAADRRAEVFPYTGGVSKAFDSMLSSGRGLRHLHQKMLAIDIPDMDQLHLLLASAPLAGSCLSDATCLPFRQLAGSRTLFLSVNSHAMRKVSGSIS